MVRLVRELLDFLEGGSLVFFCGSNCCPGASLGRGQCRYVDTTFSMVVKSYFPVVLPVLGARVTFQGKNVLKRNYRRTGGFYMSRSMIFNMSPETVLVSVLLTQ